MVQVVADSSCLIHLEKIGQLLLLEGLFGEIVVPQAVAHEVQRTVPAIPSWIRIYSLSQPIPKDIVRSSLGAGESEVMALALERKIPRVILDDIGAREFGRSLDLEVVGTGALLYKAKQRGLIPAARPLLDALLSTGFRMHPSVYQTLLRQAGEAD